MTYLELVNDVLIRLRETTVSTVSETTYSALIGKFVNDAKRQIEDSYNWNCLTQTITVTTTSGTSSYALTGAGQKFRINDAINTIDPNSGGASSGASDMAEAVRTAVINKRAGGQGLISGRKAFQRPTAEGVELLNAIQDVYLSGEVTVA